MTKVMVYQFRKRNSETDEYFVSTRMAKREFIEESNTLELIEGTGVEIDTSQLVPGEGYTEKGFMP